VHISEALQNDCSKCSERQKKGAQKVIKFLFNKKPEEWKQLQEKYDPDDTYYKKYEKTLKENAA
jgi:Insect pheromone-binding family, A10/OS-D.